MHIGGIMQDMDYTRSSVERLMAIQLAVVDRLLEDILCCIRIYAALEGRAAKPTERIYLAALAQECKRLAKIVDVEME